MGSEKAQPRSATFVSTHPSHSTWSNREGLLDMKDLGVKNLFNKTRRSTRRISAYTSPKWLVAKIMQKEVEKFQSPHLILEPVPRRGSGEYMHWNECGRTFNWPLHEFGRSQIKASPASGPLLGREKTSESKSGRNEESAVQNSTKIYLCNSDIIIRNNNSSSHLLTIK